MSLDRHTIAPFKARCRTFPCTAHLSRRELSVIQLLSCNSTFDILLLKADDLRTRSDSLSRLKSWLEILSAVRLSPGRCDGIVLTQRRMPPPGPA